MRILHFKTYKLFNMNNELEMMELEQQEIHTQNNETGGTYAENIKAAEMAGNKDMAEYYRLYTPQKLADGKLYAKDLKDRFTVLWLYYDLLAS